MTKTLPMLVIMSATAVLLTGCIHEEPPLAMAPGKYQKDVSTTDASGTTTEYKTSTNVTVDQNGNKKAVVESKTTEDPKGLFNKTTTSQSKQVIEQDQ